MSASMLRTPLFPLSAVLVSTGILVVQNHFYHQRCMTAINQLRSLHAGQPVPGASIVALEHDFPFIAKIVDEMDDDEREAVQNTAHIVEIFQADPRRFWECARKTLLEKIREHEAEKNAGGSSVTHKVPISVPGEEAVEGAGTAGTL